MTCQINQEVKKSSTEAVAGAPHDPLNAQAHTLIDVQCPTIFYNLQKLNNKKV